MKFSARAIRLISGVTPKAELTNISIFVDYNKYLDLDKDELIKLNYETRDFYYQNLSDEIRTKIDKSDGNQFFKLQNSDLVDETKEYIQFYILEQIENVLNYKNEDFKFMINYIILGGLSLVIEEVKEQYDNFNFSF